VTQGAEPASIRPVIRNACIHLSNEQPLLADLFDLPSASDVGLVCTNVRSLDGKRPIFIDSTAGVFFFPYHVIRFLEIPEGAVDLGRTGGGAAEPGYVPGAGEEPDSRLAIVVGGPGDEDLDEELDREIEIDEDFLQRIRDI
jgi:hypothetical protein